MKKSGSDKTLLGTSILLAMTSSLCCILPILAIVGGVGGFASSLSWVEPLRPYLIGATILVLGIAFYQAYKPVKADDCGCEVEKKGNFMSSKKILWSITIASALLMTFPYYSGIFLSGQNNKTVVVDERNVHEATLVVEGMSCEACEDHVNSSLLKQDGVIEAVTSYEDGTAQVKYDSTKISATQMAGVAEKETGYTITP